MDYKRGKAANQELIQKYPISAFNLETHRTLNDKKLSTLHKQDVKTKKPTYMS